MGNSRTMTAEECQDRARQCAINAGLAVSEPLALEFLRMAAQWRAVAARSIFLGSIGDHADDVNTKTMDLPPASLHTGPAEWP